MDNSSLLEEVESLGSIYINELDIEFNSSGRPEVIKIDLHPATADREDEQYVRLTLVLTLPAEYPNLGPEVAIRNPRGLDDDHLESVYTDLKNKAISKKGTPMLYEMIELAKEHLTSGNTPSGQCVICLYSFSDKDVLTKTTCYHHFHAHCLGRYICAMVNNTDPQEDNPLNEKEPEKKVVCPVCREPMVCNMDVLQGAPPPVESEAADEFAVNEELQDLQRSMAALYRKQKESGGIIDLEAEKNKYLIEIGSSSTTELSPSDSRVATISDAIAIPPKVETQPLELPLESNENNNSGRQNQDKLKKNEEVRQSLDWGDTEPVPEDDDEEPAEAKEEEEEEGDEGAASVTQATSSPPNLNVRKTRESWQDPSRFPDHFKQNHRPGYGPNQRRPDFRGGRGNRGWGNRRTRPRGPINNIRWDQRQEKSGVTSSNRADSVDKHDPAILDYGYSTMHDNNHRNVNVSIDRDNDERFNSRPSDREHYNYIRSRGPNQRNQDSRPVKYDQQSSLIGSSESRGYHHQGQRLMQQNSHSKDGENPDYQNQRGRRFGYPRRGNRGRDRYQPHGRNFRDMEREERGDDRMDRRYISSNDDDNKKFIPNSSSNSSYPPRPYSSEKDKHNFQGPAAKRDGFPRGNGRSESKSAPSVGRTYIKHPRPSPNSECRDANVTNDQTIPKAAELGPRGKSRSPKEYRNYPKESSSSLEQAVNDASNRIPFGYGPPPTGFQSGSHPHIPPFAHPFRSVSPTGSKGSQPPPGFCAKPPFPRKPPPGFVTS